MGTCTMTQLMCGVVWWHTVVLWCLIVVGPSSSSSSGRRWVGASAQPESGSAPCRTSLEVQGTAYSLSACVSLPRGAALAWRHRDGTLVAVYSAPTRPGRRWAGWGIHPSRPGQMAGSAAFLAWRDAARSAVVKQFRMGRAQNDGHPLTAPGGTALNYSAEFVDGGVKIAAALLYPGPPPATLINLVWNSGPLSGDGVPQGHDNGNDYENYFTTFSLAATGPAVAPPGKYPHKQLKYSHGILNAVAWGLLLPLGVMVARCARPFKAADPAWFYAHLCLQVSGYTLGLAAWIVGLRLRHLVDNQDDKRITHGAMGTTIFVLSTLQVLALVLRPHKEHKLRYLWNVYHHSTGYAAILFAIINIFLGFDLFAHVGLDQSRNKKAYIAVFAAMLGFALILEIVTWTVYFKNKRTSHKNTSS